MMAMKPPNDRDFETGLTKEEKISQSSLPLDQATAEQAIELARQQKAHAQRTQIFEDQKGPPMPSVGGLVSSTSDERIVNNVMRHEYRVLSDVEKAQMKEIKDRGLEFVALLHNIGGTLTEYHTKGEDARQASRNLSLAQTKIEEAVMWAVKHVTG